MNNENSSAAYVRGRCEFAAKALRRAEAALKAAAGDSLDSSEAQVLASCAELSATIAEVAEAHAAGPKIRPAEDLGSELERLIRSGDLQVIPGGGGEVRYAATPQGRERIQRMGLIPAPHQPPAAADVHTREVPDGTLSSAADNAAALAEEEAHRRRHPTCETPVQCAIAGEPEGA